MTIPAFQLDADIVVASIAKLVPVWVTAYTSPDSMVRFPYAQTHHIVPGFQQKLHVIIAHPAGFPNTFALFFDYQFGRFARKTA